MKRRKEDIDPHICLECGRDLSRGRTSAKLRHWNQWHKNDGNRDFQSLIVPKNHEHAIAFLKNKQKANISQSTSIINDETEKEPSDDELNLITHSASTSDDKRLPEVEGPFSTQEIDILEETAGTEKLSNEENSSESSVRSKEGHRLKSKKMLEKNNEVPSIGSDKVIQSSIDRYYGSVDKEFSDDPATLNQIRNDVNQVIIMLDALTIRDHPSQPVLTQNFSTDIEPIKTSQNLMEINHPEILVELLEDGCRVTCMTCKDFFASDLQSKM